MFASDPFHPEELDGQDGPKGEGAPMMMNRLEDLWKSANDGASSPISPSGNPMISESDDLLVAWYAERKKSIECGLLLEQSQKLISRLLIDSNAPPLRRKQARVLLVAIEQALRMVNASEP